MWTMFSFFFKQKTAYEMRISDWSSDVCSSDLARAQGLPLGLATDLTSGATRENAAPLKEWFFNLYPPRRRLAIVGAVHIAQLLVPMARLAGYETTVIDPRGMFAAAARFDQPVDE